MKYPLLPAIIGTALAIGITTTMDATGLTMFSALPLFVLYRCALGCTTLHES